MNEQWHLVVTAPRREASVMEGLKRQKINSFYPILRRRYQRHAWSAVHEKTFPLFPGYMFVERPKDLPKYWLVAKGSDLQQRGSAPTGVIERLMDIERTDGVVTFIRFGGEPIIIPDDVLRHVRRLMEDGCFVEDARTGQLQYLGSGDLWKPKMPTDDFIVGNNVRVTDGPFGSFIGKIIEAPSKQNRIKVILSLFGRQTEVSLELGQVEPLTQTPRISDPLNCSHRE